MLRSTTTRSILRTLHSAPRTPIASRSYTAASPQFRNVNLVPEFGKKRPQVFLSIPRSTVSALRYATKSGPPIIKINENEEHKFGEEKLTPHPEDVSSGSSVRHVFEKSPAPQTDEGQMAGAIKSDLNTIKETFSLADVPKESLYLGAAGVIPYAATSVSTVILAYDINYAHETGKGMFFTLETAQQLLDWVTPIQIGYGAVIISFLGAIHWGLEYAAYGGHQGYRRFMYGVIAPAVAWPTIFMPVEYALITQFVTFNFLYFADARATVKGWFPPWYSIYRFVLTFLVGASIVISLIGRGKILHSETKPRHSIDYINEDIQWQALQLEEKEKAKQKEKEGQAGESKDEGEGEEEGEREKSEDGGEGEGGKDEGGEKEGKDGEEKKEDEGDEEEQKEDKKADEKGDKKEKKSDKK